jgi:hypothetical protein
MFEALRVAFRQAVRNFHEELNRDSVPASEGGDFSLMYREMEAAAAKVEELRRGLRATESEANEEEESVETCLRRQEQARTIRDLETVRVSGDFVDRHRRRGEILRDKCGVLSREIEECEGELRLMHERYRTAQHTWESSRGGLAGS